ncbi:hypothetical protein YC2023_105980 [Brassica napus]
MWTARRWRSPRFLGYRQLGEEAYPKGSDRNYERPPAGLKQTQSKKSPSTEQPKKGRLQRSTIKNKISVSCKRSETSTCSKGQEAV